MVSEISSSKKRASVQTLLLLDVANDLPVTVVSESRHACFLQDFDAMGTGQDRFAMILTSPFLLEASRRRSHRRYGEPTA